MQTALPEGYRVQDIPGGVRQHFPGGYREYQKVRGGVLIHWETEGRPVSHDHLNQIFKDSFQFQDSKFWNEELPFRLNSRIDTLEKDLSFWKRAAAAGAVASSLLLGWKLLG